MAKPADVPSWLTGPLQAVRDDIGRILDIAIWIPEAPHPPPDDGVPLTSKVGALAGPIAGMRSRHEGLRERSIKLCHSLIKRGLRVSAVEWEDLRDALATCGFLGSQNPDVRTRSS